MSAPPTPPTGLPGELVDSLEACSPEQLRQIAMFADELATYRDEESTEVVAEPEADDRPDAVPAKATITVKEINNNRYYYYWQWRDGEHVRSAYKGPVNPNE